MKRMEIIGRKFGKLTVLKYSHTFNGASQWICQCECGNIKTCDGGNIKDGITKSCGCLSHLPYGNASFNLLYRQYRDRAKKRNIAFELSIDEFKYITQLNCHYCNIEPQQAVPTGNEIRERMMKSGQYTHNGIDRMDNRFGYTYINSLPCCSICNRAKNTMEYIKFQEYINRFKKGLTNVN